MISSHFQAMGVYLYGELMVNEDAKQQDLARQSFATMRDQMDVSSAKVVAEMLFWSGDPPPHPEIGNSSACLLET